MKAIIRMRTLALAGLATIGGAMGLSADARAQGYGAVSIQFGSGGYGQGYGGRGHGIVPSPGGACDPSRGRGIVGGYAATSYVPAPPTPYPPGYDPNLPYSPAQQQGWREGRAYYETGLAPNHRLSPAEARGFAAGVNRQAQTPWQLDPAKQQGWREGQYFFETGILPNRPLTPAEREGFLAAQRQRSGGGNRTY